SRRRHTRCLSDWSSDVCSSDLGDGSGAAILQSRPKAHGLLTACMGADGNKADLLSMPGGGCRCPATADSVSARLHFLRMEGKEKIGRASCRERVERRGVAEG